MIKCFLQARCGAHTINPNKQVDLCECNGSLVYIAQASPPGGEGEKDEMGGEKHKESLLILFSYVCSCHGTCVEVRGQLLQSVHAFSPLCLRGRTQSTGLVGTVFTHWVRSPLLVGKWACRVHLSSLNLSFSS